MTRLPSDAMLNALLASYVPPPVPGDLAARAGAAATALPQEGLAALPRRAPNRRGAWLRRPLLAGGAALGLAFSGAVAATYAGVELPPKVRSVLADIPFVGVTAPEPRPAPAKASRPQRPASSPPASAAPQPRQAQSGERPFAGFWRELSLPERRRLRQAPPGRRLLVAKRIVDERRAAGLPTPHADRIEQAIAARRAARTQGEPVPPTARQRWRIERQARLREALRALEVQQGDPSPPDMAAPQNEEGRDWRDLMAQERRERREERRRRLLERQGGTPESAPTEASTQAQVPAEEF